MPSPQGSDRPRYRIGRYVVAARIGKGGMGMVYRGLDEALEREVAVKTLTLEGSLDEESRRRFEVEAKAAAKLQHPNIVTVFELSEDRGVPFIAMELLPGADLEAIMRSGEALLLAEKLEIVIQVCRGLAYAHDHGIFHRDIKPSNIRLLDDGTAKIMDFGIAKLGSTSLTKTGMMVGTVNYMSPEQARGRAVDGRSDLFSVAVILYELLAGHRPFRGQGPTDILYKIVHEPPEALDPASLRIDPELSVAVARALEKEPEKRFPTAAAFADVLQGVLDRLKREANPAVPAEPLSAARRLLKEGRVEESLTRLRALAEGIPTSVEVRRTLRAASREMQRQSGGAATRSDDFPELAATLGSPTEQPAGTVVLPPTVYAQAPGTTVIAGPKPARPLGGLVAGAGVLAFLGLGLGVLLLRGRSEPREAASTLSSPPPAPPVTAAIPPPASGSGVTATTLPPKPEIATAPAAAAPAPRPPQSVIVPVITDPPGAAVSVDGQPVKGATPLDLTLDPSRDHRVAVSLDSYATQETTLAAGKARGELRLRLEPAGPLASVTVASSYPIDVFWRGRSLARGQVSPRVEVPGGRQVLSVASATHFVRADVAITVAPGAEATVDAPPLGRISIRANPDTCKVFIDDTFVDYPPIIDKPVGAGPHEVSFKWPDGSETKEAVVVPPGKVAFVSGRK
jgi:serine/threonine-protein kinase